LLNPAVKLATARMLDTATASHTLGEALGLGSVTAREIYTTLDWITALRAPAIRQLAQTGLGCAVHAGVLPGVAHALTVGADVVRRP
jgi:hypothetical protein